ncbi:MAG: hypothetical protein ACI4AH_05295 [Muribaculaceae bacterium]
MNNEKEHIATLIERFMNGESSLADEEQLSRYFASHEVDAEWMPYKQMFAYFDSGMLDAPVQSKPKGVVRRWIWRSTCAAAVVLAAIACAWHLLGGGDELPQNSVEHTASAGNASVVAVPDTAGCNKVMAAEIVKTPAVQHATAAARPSRRDTEYHSAEIDNEELRRLIEAQQWTENMVDASCELALEEMIEARRAVDREMAAFVDTIDLQLTQLITVP